MAGKWLVLAALMAAAPATCAVVAECGLPGRHVATAETGVFTAETETKLKGYDIAPTGLKPAYPQDFACSPLTSLYASWIDVDGSQRDEPHSGVDGGRLGDAVLAPAAGTVRRVWIADWGQGREGALLIVHAREDLNLSAGVKFYYSAFYHLKYDDIRGLRQGERISRGQRIAKVFRPGGKSEYLPEVHLEVYEVGDDAALTWSVGKRGTEYFENETYRLVDPLYLMSLEVRPTDELDVLLQPFEPRRDYRAFKGFTYFLPCRKRAAGLTATSAGA